MHRKIDYHQVQAASDGINGVESMYSKRHREYDVAMRKTLLLVPLIVPVFGGAVLTGCSQQRVPDVQIAPRASWADAEPIVDRLKEHTPDRLTIHHAGVNDDGGVPGAQKMRNLLRFSQRDKPWGDVPYHFVIDRQGNIWAGRALEYAPDTNTGYDVTGHVGICVNGDLTKQPLLEAQYRALVDLLVKLAADLNIVDERIAGHMDFSPGGTSCPGALEHYIRDGTLLNNMRAVRTAQSYQFVLKSYDHSMLTETQDPGR